MLDENDEPVIRIHADDQQVQGKSEKEVPKIYYLLIPPGKKRGSFWIWIPDYVAHEINAWKRERGPQQKQMLDWKTNEEVDLLFCDRDNKVGVQFLNTSLIPLLCTKAGIDMKDAIGRITGHRGRSTRLTLLRNNGVSLEDLAEYAGHNNTRTIKHYARQNPIQLHRRIKKADDTSRVIEGVVDLQAAAKGQPALRWFIGYDADGEPMFCGNQHFITCAHRLDCERCGMFIGGEKAKLLEDGKNALPIEAKVPMTPIEKCVVDGDQEGAEACRAALKKISAPEAPDISLIFNPEGLSNHELEKLAQLATADALDKLRQALDAHQKKLAEVQKNKTGRNALVGGQKKRISLIQKLIADCEQTIDEQQSGHA